VPTIFDQEISGTEEDYRVEVSFDDPEDDVASSGRFEIRGGRRQAGTEMWQEVTLRGEVDLAQDVIVLSSEGRELTRLPMDPELGGPDQAEDLIRNDDPVDRALELLDIERIIEHLPVVDPFLGCLIRSAASVSIGKIIRCWLANDRTRSARTIASCVFEDSRRLLLKFAFKAGKCAVTYGLL
jgi:hypothetical protein